MSAVGDGKSRVLAAIDIVQVIGQSVKLTRRGSKYVGLCPFHQEKTPSFTVTPDRQVFYCFGCKAGGSVFDFVMKRDRIEFRDALELLAKQAGIDLPNRGEGKRNAGERQQLLEACSAAVAFFDKLLQHPAVGKPAREYLTSRGFTAESIRKFSIGFATDSWDGLLTNLSRKFSLQTLHQAGLIKQKDGADRYYDTFRDRVMFPIRDETGRTIAFGGRVMPGSEAPAKYLNSPETPLFSKSRAIFGLDLAKQKIVETRTVAVVEGYTDVVMAHQFGASNVVSILGTAMTEPHVALLRRFADRIVLLFDADTAGDSAVNRTVELFLTQPIEIAVASIPEDLDPDEYLMKHGVEAFNALLANAVDALTFKWQLLEKQYRAADGITGQQKALSAYLDVLSGARGSGPVDSLRWGAALGQVAKLTGMPLDDLHKRFAAKSRPQRRQNNVTDVAQATESQTPTSNDGALPVQAAQEMAERQVLGIVFVESERWLDVQKDVQPEDFGHPVRRELAEIFWDVCRHDGEPEFAEFLTNLPSETMRSVAMELFAVAEELSQREHLLAGSVQHLCDARKRLAQDQTAAAARKLGNQKDSPSTGEDDSVALLRQLTEQARRPDIRRNLG